MEEQQVAQPEQPPTTVTEICEQAAAAVTVKPKKRRPTFYAMVQYRNVAQLEPRVELLQAASRSEMKVLLADENIAEARVIRGFELKTKSKRQVSFE